MEKLLKAQFDMALEKMPQEFSSKMFCTECRKLGTQEISIRNGHSKKYLITKCTKTSERTWLKIKHPEAAKNEPQGKLEQPELFEKNSRIALAIKILKDAGYKVFKPETSFTEI
jgi:hypothetical protein